jgi:hypothetical protein
MCSMRAVANGWGEWFRCGRVALAAAICPLVVGCGSSPPATVDAGTDARAGGAAGSAGTGGSSGGGTGGAIGAGGAGGSAGRGGAGGAARTACDVGNCVVQTIALATVGRDFQGIALDANYIYVVAPGQLGVSRANLDGSNLILNFTTTLLNDPEGIAIDSRYIYVTQPSNNYSDRASIDGTNLIEGYIGGDFPIGIAVDAKYIYFANQAESTIGRAAIDASSIDYGFITGCSYPNGLAIDGHYLYWANQGSATVSTPHRSIGRANIDGTGVNQDLIPKLPFAPTAVTVNDRHIYFLRADDPGGINRAALDGSSVELGFLTVPTIRSRPYGIASNDTAIYWTVDDAIQMALR